MAKLNLVSVRTQLNEEKVPAAAGHIYYGLKDSRGWLSRFPEIDTDGYGGGFAISREEMIEFLQAGGRLDRMGTWGVNPYRGFEGLSPSKAAEFLLVAHCQRWDNVPHAWGTDFEVSESCTFYHYLKLHEGAATKRALNKFGISTNASLFTLASKSIDWYDRKVAANFQFTPAFLEWGKDSSLEGLREISGGNAAFTKYVADREKYSVRLDSVEYRSSVWKRAKTLQFMNLYNRGVKSLRARNVIANMNTPFSMRTSLGNISFLKGHLVPIKDYSSEVEDYTPCRVRQTGVYSIAKVSSKFFVWVTAQGFSSHIEGYNLKDIFAKLAKKLLREEETEEAMKGNLNFKTFQELTHSCLSGTRDFLYSRAKHLYNLLAPFGSWEEVLKSDVSNIKFQLTPEFMESIKFRF